MNLLINVFTKLSLLGQNGRWIVKAFLSSNNQSNDYYEDVLYDAESLFTSIPVQETIDYILYKT